APTVRPEERRGASAGGTRDFAAAPAPATRGRVTANHAMAAKTAAAGKNPSTVNLQTTASPVTRPNTALCSQVGSSAHSSIAKNAAVKQPASGMSVVASPACASTVGTIV